MSTPNISGREPLKIFIPQSTEIPIPKTPLKETRVFRERVLNEPSSKEKKERSWEPIKLTSSHSIHYESFSFHVGTKPSYTPSTHERRKEKISTRESFPIEPRLSAVSTIVDRSSRLSPLQKENINHRTSSMIKDESEKENCEDTSQTDPQSKNSFSANWQDELQFPFEEEELQ